MEELLLFNDNVKKINLNSTIEQNNFKLVREYLNGNIIEDELGIDSDSLEIKFITKSINEIKNKISSSHYNGSLKVLLNEKLNKLSKLFGEFKVYDSLSQKTKLDGAEIKLFNENKRRLFYLILELKASLGLSLDEIYHEDIMDYCNILAIDVNNGKYKRLDFQSHIHDNGKVIIYK